MATFVSRLVKVYADAAPAEDPDVAAAAAMRCRQLALACRRPRRKKTRDDLSLEAATMAGQVADRIRDASEDDWQRMLTLARHEGVLPEELDPEVHAAIPWQELRLPVNPANLSADVPTSQSLTECLAVHMGAADAATCQASLKLARRKGVPRVTDACTRFESAVQRLKRTWGRVADNEALVVYCKAIIFNGFQSSRGESKRNAALELQSPNYKRPKR